MIPLLQNTYIERCLSSTKISEVFATCLGDLLTVLVSDWTDWSFPSLPECWAVLPSWLPPLSLSGRRDPAWLAIKHSSLKSKKENQDLHHKSGTLHHFAWQSDATPTMLNFFFPLTEVGWQKQQTLKGSSAATQGGCVEDSVDSQRKWAVKHIDGVSPVALSLVNYPYSDGAHLCHPSSLWWFIIFSPRVTQTAQWAASQEEATLGK